MRQSDVNPLARFLQKVEAHGFDPGQCWEWRGPVSSNGYGHFPSDNKHKLAHRCAYEFFVGVIPNGKCVCHACDNRLCVNPHHLWIGTQSDNLRDAAAKGRIFRPDTNGEKNGNRKLSADNVRLMRRMFEGGQKRYQIADRFGVSPSTVGEIIAGKIWKDVA